MKIGGFPGLLLFFLSLSAAAQNGVPPGLLLDDEEYLEAPYSPILTKAPLPKRISFEAYCPPVQAQGAYGTCVGFACGYYLRTILEAQNQQITDKSQLAKLAFSPSYLYEKAKSAHDYACTEGVRLTKVFAVLKEQGVVPAARFPYPACGQHTQAVDEVAGRYRIRAYERLFKDSDQEPTKIYSLKKALAEGSPVVVGIVVQASFYTAGKVWQPAPGDTPNDVKLGGHALCVIGYDDQRYGGAFRVVNSFGKQWADQGFCWIRYQDLARFTRYGFKTSEKGSPL